MKKNIKRADILLVSALIAAGLVLAAILLLTGTHGSCAEIRVDGTVVKTIPLDTETEYAIEGIGGTNTLVIRDGCAYISDADCEDELCVHMGKIRYKGQSIICLPHKVVVEITGGDVGTTAQDTDIIIGGAQ